MRVGCIRNDAVLLFDVEKHKPGAANVLIYSRSLIMHFGGESSSDFRETPLMAIYLAVVVYTMRFCE